VPPRRHRNQFAPVARSGVGSDLRNRFGCFGFGCFEFGRIGFSRIAEFRDRRLCRCRRQWRQIVRLFRFRVGSFRSIRHGWRQFPDLIRAGFRMIGRSILCDVVQGLRKIRWYL